MYGTSLSGTIEFNIDRDRIIGDFLIEGLRQVVSNHFHYWALTFEQLQLDIDRDRIIVYETIRRIEQVLDRRKNISFVINNKLSLEANKLLDSISSTFSVVVEF